jgi:hypothetical protein
VRHSENADSHGEFADGRAKASSATWKTIQIRKSGMQERELTTKHTKNTKNNFGIEPQTPSICPIDSRFYAFLIDFGFENSKVSLRVHFDSIRLSRKITYKLDNIPMSITYPLS